MSAGDAKSFSENPSRRIVSGAGGQASGIIARGFFTVETALLKTLCVLSFIEIGTRRARVTVSTSNPDSVFVTQQAQNLAMGLPDDQGAMTRFLIRDRDAKFSCPFDEVLASEGIRVICTSIRAPNANAFGERWVETLRADCLDRLLILGPRHLDRRRAGRLPARSSRWAHLRIRERGMIEYLYPTARLRLRGICLRHGFSGLLAHHRACRHQ